MTYILFNPKANNTRGETDARNWAKNNDVSAEFVSVIGLDLKKFFDGLKNNDEVILAGGDGTLNRFANDTYGFKFPVPVYYAKCGTGNDFYRDTVDYQQNGKIDLRVFLKKVPVVKVKGISRYFLNNVAFGLDGQTCEVGDDIRAKDPSAVINYAKIAIKLLLGGYKLRKATVEVDGKVYNYKHVWLASTMFGKYYGGGMMCAPKQNRLNKEGTCTVVTFTSIGRLITLLRFPAFSSGNHTGKKWLTSMTGKHIKVTFDIPCAVHIDGEVVKNVTTYEVICE